MAIPASSADIFAASAFLIPYSLSVSLFVKQCTLLTAICLKQIIPISSKPCSQKKSVQKFLMVTFPNYFLIFTADFQHSTEKATTYVL